MNNIVYMTGVIIMLVLTSTVVCTSNTVNANKSSIEVQYVVSNYENDYEYQSAEEIDTIEELEAISDYEEEIIIEDNDTEEVVQIEEVPQVVAPVEPVVTKEVSLPYYIKVNRTQNVVNIYTKDSEGNYTVPYKVMLCSTGSATPASGKKHKITTFRRQWLGLIGGVYGQYATQIVGNILFHSVPYTAKDPSALEYWEYDKLGTKASLGCIRLSVENAKWIYDNISAGTVVEFYEDEEPGPLGKPDAVIISNNELCRGWDPTDIREENPWNNPQVLEEQDLEEKSVEDFLVIDVQGTLSGEAENIEIVQEYSSGEDYDNQEIIKPVVVEAETETIIEQESNQKIEVSEEVLIEEPIIEEISGEVVQMCIEPGC